MFTLIYFNGSFNKPGTLRPYLQANVGCDTLLQVDCISPFKGTADELADKVCQYLNGIDPMIEVIYNYIQNASTESGSNGCLVHFLVIQLNIKSQ
jgi:hypothetical protein